VPGHGSVGVAWTDSCVRRLSAQLRASDLRESAGGSTREWSGRWVCLPPDVDDRLRDELERNARIVDAAADSIPSLLADAFNHRDRDITACFGGLVDICLHVTVPSEEIWVTIATQATDGRFVEERLRDVLFGLVLDAAEAELWEPRADWPSGELAWFEVARLGLREPPS
jgi:hypothetical protein